MTPQQSADADDGPDVVLYGPVFSQCQAGSGRTLFYKNPVNVKHIELEPNHRKNPAVVVRTFTMMLTEDAVSRVLCNCMLVFKFFHYYKSI